MHEYGDSNFLDLVGKILIKVEMIKNSTDGDELIFKTAENETYKLYHSQDCCESVYIEDICGDLTDLLHTPILQAEEIESETNMPTWTFYKLSTIKGSVTIRWIGQSNGYYSERVDFTKMEN